MVEVGECLRSFAAVIYTSVLEAVDRWMGGSLRHRAFGRLDRVCGCFVFQSACVRPSALYCGKGSNQDVNSPTEKRSQANRSASRFHWRLTWLHAAWDQPAPAPVSFPGWLARNACSSPFAHAAASLNHSHIDGQVGEMRSFRPYP